MISDKAFWQYALGLYSANGVTDICLRLQDSLGLNVNLILLLCYAEQNRQQLGSEQIEQLSLSVAKWHTDYTKPLRALRRRLALEDSASIDAKQAVFDAEMELEKVEQKLLLSVYNRLKTTTSDKPQNLQRYLAMADNKAPMAYGEDIDYLRTVIESR